MGHSIVSGKHVVVIGGGVIGAACAHYLAADGHRITIVDRDGFGSGSSHGNCGYIALGHVLPLTEPGAVMKTMKALGRRNSPFYVKPRFDPALWTWLLRFAAKCNEKHMMAAAKVRAGILHSSGELYDELMQTLGGACECERVGNLFVHIGKQHRLLFMGRGRTPSQQEIISFFDRCCHLSGYCLSR